MSASRKKKTNNSKNGVNTTLRVEGYAFEDDVIGVAHVRSDGEDAFNMNLRNMVVQDDLREKGFSAYVTLRDKLSGKDDAHLRGADGFPKYLFMSINMHKFDSATAAADAVIDQCKKLHKVHNVIIFLELFGNVFFSPQYFFLRSSSIYFRLQVIQCTTFLVTHMMMSPLIVTKQVKNFLS